MTATQLAFDVPSPVFVEREADSCHRCDGIVRRADSSGLARCTVCSAAHIVRWEVWKDRR